MPAPTKRAVESKAAEAKPEKERTEFLTVAMGEDLRVGSSIRIIGVSESEQEAKKSLESLTEGGTGRVAILEKKGVFERRPAVVVTPLKANIVRQPEQ